MIQAAEYEFRYMRRALQLAANGYGHVSPNPMVGAVIVDSGGRIIGEGWHQKYGGPHAEVNAINSVATDNCMLLKNSTMYVTLEPCSHYGKTPPCANLLIERGIRKVVVGVGDPNPNVAGNGIAMLREAGIDVVEGVLADESYALNKTFMTAHTLHRPFITLKWARSADGYMDKKRATGSGPVHFSVASTDLLTHIRRSRHDAIAVGAGTVLADNPSLNVRHIEGKDPLPLIFDRHGLVNIDNCKIYDRAIHITEDKPLAKTLSTLFCEKGIISLLVEGGANLLGQFIEAGLWDEAYEEISPIVLGNNGCVKAPVIAFKPEKTSFFVSNRVNFYSHSHTIGVKNI